MTTTIDTTEILEQLRAVARAQEERARAEREQEARERERADDAAFRTLANEIRAYLPEAVRALGWEVERGAGPLRQAYLCPTFLPPDVPPLKLPVSVGPWRGADGLTTRYFLAVQGGARDRFIEAGWSADRVLAVLAPLVVAHVEDARRTAAAEARWQEAEAVRAAREDRARVYLAGLARTHRRVVDAELATIAAGWGWPADARLAVAEIAYPFGTDAAGAVRQHREWVLDWAPVADSAYRVEALTPAGELVTKRIYAPTLVVVEREWASTDDLPDGLRERVRIVRRVRVVGAGVDLSEWVEGELTIPCRALRARLGQSAEPVPAEADREVRVRLIAVGATPEEHADDGACPLG